VVHDGSRSDYTSYRGWKGWRPDAFGAITAEDRAYFEGEFRRCGAGDLSDADVLEIGFGNGSFAAWCSEQGARYRGTEQIVELLEIARARGFDALDASMPLESFVDTGSVDLVVALDVFEHLELGDLRELVRSLAGLLKPSGLLVARVPSGDSPFSRSVQYGDLTHRTILGSSSIQQLADEVDLEVVQTREPAFPLRGLGIMACIRRSAVFLVRSLVYPLTTHALMGGGHPILTPNLVFVLRRPDRDAARPGAS